MQYNSPINPKQPGFGFIAVTEKNMGHSHGNQKKIPSILRESPSLGNSECLVIVPEDFKKFRGIPECHMGPR